MKTTAIGHGVVEFSSGNAGHGVEWTNPKTLFSHIDDTIAL